jgi:hypothetical protein
MSALNDFDSQQAEIDKRFSLVSDKLEIATPYGGTDAGEANREGASILLGEIKLLIKRNGIYERRLLKYRKER